MRICFWSTTFQSDTHALAHYLASQPDCEVTVVMAEPERFRRAPVLSLLPFPGRLCTREEASEQHARGGAFDCVVLDNHVPGFAIAPRVYVLWHGFGWRVDDLKTMRKELSRLVGDVSEDNPRFRWQAIGHWDRRYRIEHSQLSPSNVLALGSPFSDWLLPGSALRARFDKRAQQASYSIDLSRPVVLLALTWHHIGSLGHWGDEEQRLGQLFEHIAARGASTLLRMHDRRRYRSSYVKLVERLAARFSGSLMLKWKDSAPDSLLDLLVSDVCISNYSSLLNTFYFTERPSIHIDPHDAAAACQQTYKMVMGWPMRKTLSSADDLWKLPPDQHGGLRAQSFDQLLAHVDTALADPACCITRARKFIADYVADANGQSCERTANALRSWLRE